MAQDRKRKIKVRFSSFSGIDADTAFFIVTTLLTTYSLTIFLPRGAGLFTPLFLLLGVYASFRLIKFQAHLRRLAKRCWPLFLLSAYVTISFAWSDTPSATIKNIVMYLSGLSIALFISVRFSAQEIIRVLSGVCLVFIVASAVVEVALPNLARTSTIDHHGGSWSGLYPHRLFLAELAALGVFLFLIEWLQAKGAARRYALLKVLFAFFVLFMCNSKMALLAGGGSTLVLLAARFGQTRRLGAMKLSRSIVIGLFVFSAVTTVSAGVAIAPHLPELVGRNDNFSGRTRFWKWGFYWAEDKPIAGTGFRSFWEDERKSFTILMDRRWLADQIGTLKSSRLSNGHNGYYDVYFELGLLGVVLFTIFIVHALFTLIKALSLSPDIVLAFVASLMAFMMVRNVTETVFLEATRLFWILFIWSYAVSAAYVAQARRDRSVLKLRLRLAPRTRLGGLRPSVS